jgi:hypothetical protein
MGNDFEVGLPFSSLPKVQRRPRNNLCNPKTFQSVDTVSQRLQRPILHLQRRGLRPYHFSQKKEARSLPFYPYTHRVGGSLLPQLSSNVQLLFISLPSQLKLFVVQRQHSISKRLLHSVQCQSVRTVPEPLTYNSSKQEQRTQAPSRTTSTRQCRTLQIHARYNSLGFPKFGFQPFTWTLTSRSYQRATQQ